MASQTTNLALKLVQSICNAIHSRNLCSVRPFAYLVSCRGQAYQLTSRSSMASATSCPTTKGATDRYKFTFIHTCDYIFLVVFQIGPFHSAWKHMYQPWNISHIILHGKLVPRVYHWKTFSITRVYLTKTDVSAFTSAVVSDYKNRSAKWLQLG